jgi:hypothetical protein
MRLFLPVRSCAQKLTATSVTVWLDWSESRWIAQHTCYQWWLCTCWAPSNDSRWISRSRINGIIRADPSHGKSFLVLDKFQNEPFIELTLLNKGEGGCDRPKSTEWTFFYIATLWNAFNNPWRLCLTDATSVARSVISQRLALRELLFLWSQRTENGRNFASNSYSHSSFWQTSRGSSTCTAIQSSEDTDPSGIQIDLTTLTLISRIWLLVIDAEVNGILVSALIDSGAQGSRLELQNDYTLLEERRRNLRSEFSARLEPSKTVLNHSPKPRSLIICIQW